LVRSPARPDVRAREAVHDPYFALDGASGRGKEALAGARAAVEQWGGSVQGEEAAEGGIEYRVCFPASDDRVAPASGPRAEVSGRSGAATILVVDDEPTLRSVIRRCLVREGHTVLVAESGERALELSRQHQGQLDLLVTDVVMPGFSGLELAERLRQDRCDLPVLFISGFTFEECVPAAGVANMAYLPKPFDTQVLAAQVRELLGGSATPEAAASG
jgi:CheY-like chemotaxis protein